MSFEYRVLRTEDYAEVIEVYYDDDGNFVGWCPVTLAGDSVRDLLDTLELLERAATKTGAIIKPEELQAKPGGMQTDITVIDGMDGYTPEMLRSRSDRASDRTDSQEDPLPEGEAHV